MSWKENKILPVLSLCLWILIVASLSTLPVKGKALEGIWWDLRWDYWVHTILYFVFAFLLGWTLHLNSALSRLRIVYTAIFISTAFGFLMEIIQLYVPELGRSFEWNDALFNFAGAAMGAFLFLLIFKNK